MFVVWGGSADWHKANAELRFAVRLNPAAKLLTKDEARRMAVNFARVARKT